MPTVPIIGGSTSIATSTSGASSVALTYSSLGTISAGDLILLFGVNTFNNVFTVPTGFTSDYNITAINTVDDAAAIACHKIATGTESGSLTVSWGTSKTALGAAAMIRLTGVAATSPISSTTNVDTGSGAVSYTAPTPTSTGPGGSDMVVRCWMNGGDDVAKNWKSGQINSPSGWTVAQSAFTANTTSSSLFNTGLMIAYLQGGTSTPAVTAAVTGTFAPAWMVTEYDIVGLPSSAASPDLYILNVPMMRAGSF